MTQQTNLNGQKQATTMYTTHGEYDEDRLEANADQDRQKEAQKDQQTDSVTSKSYDDSDTMYGSGGADDDTSAGYGLGESTGNSSQPQTGLGPDGD
ncbi:MAG TPA: hypothetical protein VH186_04695 [Chloroflexia bacterium]|nr:hypothetical protein [Chloroflexia bacterium]